MTAIGYKVGTSDKSGGHAGYDTRTNCTLIGSELEANGTGTIMIGHHITPSWIGVPTDNSMFDTTWSTTTNSIIIGNDLTAGSNSIVLGSTSQNTLMCKAALNYVDNFCIPGPCPPAHLYINDLGMIGTYTPSKIPMDNIKEMTSIDWLYKLRPVSYTSKGDLSGRQQFGLVADEVNKIAPSLVTTDRNGDPDAVSYDELAAPLLKALQDQKKMIEDLQKEVEILKNR
jgi:hypothetical protein